MQSDIQRVPTYMLTYTERERDRQSWADDQDIAPMKVE